MIRLSLPVAIVLLALDVVVPAVPAATDEDLAALSGTLAARTVRPPGKAGAVAVFGTDDGSAVLDPTRLATLLATVEEAEAWPDLWAVVQDEGLDWDLVLRLTLEDSGAVVPGDAAAVARRPWDDARALRDAVRDALGRKPDGKFRNVVVQGFTKRIVTLYPYEAVDVPRDRGLLALLPEDAILREARTVTLSDGRRYTLALILRGARFEPADCGTPRGRALGHLDRGTVLAVLAGPDGLAAELDLGAQGADGARFDGEGALPRYRCAEGESPETLEPARVRDWIRARDPMTLLVPEDRDGDGHALEFLLPRAERGREGGTFELRVDPGAPALSVGPADRRPPGADAPDGR